MDQYEVKKVYGLDLPEKIFTLGTFAALFKTVSIAFAIVAYFIWPYR